MAIMTGIKIKKAPMAIMTKTKIKKAREEEESIAKAQIRIKMKTLLRRMRQKGRSNMVAIAKRIPTTIKMTL